VVTIGGGTGQFVLLSGLKHYKNLDITAIVSMADDGGSTGELRDEYGVLPPGDLRQCLVALAEEDGLLREAMTYRFECGSFAGHNFGNLLLSVFEKISPNYNEMLDGLAAVLRLRGRVVPVTTSKVRLRFELGDGATLRGQYKLALSPVARHGGVHRIRLEPRARLNPLAAEAVRHADLIVVGPGGLYDSLLPNFAVSGFTEVFRAGGAKKIAVAPLMNRRGQTDDMTVYGFMAELERFIGAGSLDAVVVNAAQPRAELLRKYESEGEPVMIGVRPKEANYRLMRANLLGDTITKPKRGDFLRRTLIRHDPAKLARAVLRASFLRK